MRGVIQRAREGSVVVDGKSVGEIGVGLVVLTGFGLLDERNPPLEKFIEKILHMRIFSDTRGKFAHSLKDIQGGLLLVPQFTLYADCSRGKRPELSAALKSELAATHFEQLLKVARMHHPQVASGIFGADMQVRLINDGPVTISLEVE